MDATRDTDGKGMGDGRRDLRALVEGARGNPNEDLLRCLIEENPNLFLVVDMAGQLVYVNRAFVDFFGTLPPPGRSIFEDRFLTRAGKIDEVRRAFRGETVLLPDVPVNLRDLHPAYPDREFRIQMLLYPLRDAAGTFERVAVVMTDVTRRLQAEAQLAEARKLELVGRLAGGVAHDFNNLLTGMLGHLNLLSRELSPEGKARAAKVEGLIERGAKLVRQLLGFARGGKFERRPVELTALAREHLDLFLGTRRGIRVEPSFAAHPVTVEADPVQVEQVLLNLLLNAAEAMDGRGVVRISTGACGLSPREAGPLSLAAGGYAFLEVADEGPGIPAEHLPRIFEPFFSTKSKDFAAGMGLASASGIARAHGGAIAVESVPGRGSAFRLLLPLSRTRDTPEAADAPPVPSGGRRILLADDEPDVRDSTAELLAVLGHTVAVAATGEAAAEQASREPFDLFLFDAVMPGMGGGEALALARAARPGVPSILMSGYSDADGIADAAEVFLRKPFTLEELSRAVEAALRANPAGTGEGAIPRA